MHLHFLIPPKRLHWIIRWHGLSIFVGFGLIAGAVLSVPFGVFSGMMAVMYGASCGAFREWCCHRGLWMLSAGFLVLLVPVYLMLAWLDTISGVPKTWWGVDMLLGTTAAGMTARLLLSVTVYNWRFSRAWGRRHADAISAQPGGAGNGRPAGARP